MRNVGYIKPKIKIKNKKILILGEAGSGKTLYLQKIMEKQYKKTFLTRIFDPLFLYIHISNIDSELDVSICSNIFKLKIEDPKFAVLKNIINKIINNGKSFILIDGLEHLAGRGCHANNILSQINTLLDINQLNIYVSCRIEYYKSYYKKYLEDNTNNKIEIVNLPLFTNENIKEYIELSENNVNSKKALKQSIFENIATTSMPIYNPMILAVLVLIFKKSDKISFQSLKTRRDVYKKFCNALILEEEKNIEKYKHLKEKQYILNSDYSHLQNLNSCLSYEILKENKNLNRGMLMISIRNYFHSKGMKLDDEVIDEIISFIINTGILLQDKNKIIRFFHDSILEYYSSIYFENKENELFSNLEKTPEKWSNVFLLWFSNIKSIEKQDKLSDKVMDVDIITSLLMLSDRIEQGIIKKEVISKSIFIAENIYKENTYNNRLLRVCGSLAANTNFYFGDKIFTFIKKHYKNLLCDYEKSYDKNKKNTLKKMLIHFSYPLSLTNRSEASELLLNANIAYKKLDSLDKYDSTKNKIEMNFINMKDVSLNLLFKKIKLISVNKKKDMLYKGLVSEYFNLITKMTTKKSLNISVNLLFMENINIAFSPFFCSLLFDNKFKKNIDSIDLTQEVEDNELFSWISKPFVKETEINKSNYSKIMVYSISLYTHYIEDTSNIIPDRTKIKIDKKILILLCAIYYYEESNINNKDLTKEERKNYIWSLKHKSFLSYNLINDIRIKLRSLDVVNSLRWQKIFDALDKNHQRKLLIILLNIDYKPNIKYWNKEIFDANTYSFQRSREYLYYKFIVNTVLVLTIFVSLLEIYSVTLSKAISIEQSFMGIFTFLTFLSWNLYIKAPLAEEKDKKPWLYSVSFFIICLIYSPLLSIVSRLIMPKMLSDTLKKQERMDDIHDTIINSLPIISWVTSISAIWFIFLKQYINNIPVLISILLSWVVVFLSIKYIWNIGQEKEKLTNPLSGILKNENPS